MRLLQSSLHLDNNVQLSRCSELRGNTPVIFEEPGALMTRVPQSWTPCPLRAASSPDSHCHRATGLISGRHDRNFVRARMAVGGEIVPWARGCRLIAVILLFAASPVYGSNTCRVEVDNPNGRRPVELLQITVEEVQRDRTGRCGRVDVRQPAMPGLYGALGYVAA